MLRKIVWVLVILCACLLSPFLGVAQDKAPEVAKNAISINVLGTVITAIADSTSGLVAVPVYVDYQRVLCEHYTLSIIPRFEFLIASTNHDSIAKSYLDSFDFQPWVEVDWHPFDKGLNGFFVGLAAVASLNVSWSSNNSTVFLGVAPVVGYQILLPWNINLDFALGVALGGNIVVDPFGNATSGLAVGPSRIELGLGYRF
jgi:hypothetical protein